MNRELKDQLSVLRDEGYVVVIFTPDELEGADAQDVEQELALAGWDTIEKFKPAQNIPKCPRCGSEDLTWDEITVDGKIARQEAGCGICNFEWYDVFRLTGWEDR